MPALDVSPHRQARWTSKTFRACNGQRLGMHNGSDIAAAAEAAQWETPRSERPQEHPFGVPGGTFRSVLRWWAGQRLATRLHC
ncbi:hypothetical protein GCM10027280_08820 [Micromonospora polyrhachis]